MTIKGYYTPQEIRQRFRWSRQMLQFVAEREGWRREAVGNTFIYLAEDVDRYALESQRTRLAKELGWKPGKRGWPLIKHDDFDIACPVCGAFAVEYGPDAVQASGKPPWKCVNGHSDDGREK
jgi:hypothetical protein